MNVISSCKELGNKRPLEKLLDSENINPNVLKNRLHNSYNGQSKLIGKTGRVTPDSPERLCRETFTCDVLNSEIIKPIFYPKTLQFPLAPVSISTEEGNTSSIGLDDLLGDRIDDLDFKKSFQVECCADSLIAGLPELDFEKAVKVDSADSDELSLQFDFETSDLDLDLDSDLDLDLDSESEDSSMEFDEKSDRSTTSTQLQEFDCFSTSISRSSAEKIMNKIISKRKEFEDICDISADENRFYQAAQYTLIESGCNDLTLDKIYESLDESYSYATIVHRSQKNIGQFGSLGSIRHLQVKHMMQIAPIIGLSKYDIGFSETVSTGKFRYNLYLSYEQILFNITRSDLALVYVDKGIVLGMINYSTQYSHEDYVHEIGYIHRLISYKNSPVMKNLLGDSLNGYQIGAPLLTAACDDVSIVTDLVLLEPLDNAKTFYLRNGFTPDVDVDSDGSYSSSDEDARYFKKELLSDN